MLCHCLIGLPASGKTTFARQWNERDATYTVVSTDAIRADLYGDESVLGDWSDIEAEVVKPIEVAIASGRSVIYDATNAKRSWRLAFLQNVKTLAPDVDWMAWYLDVPLSRCKARNRQRPRHVPTQVIDDMATALKTFPPQASEGFVAVSNVPFDRQGNVDFDAVKKAINNLPLRQSRRDRRNSVIEWHEYSRLLDFERLLYLIALLLKYPGVGQLESDVLRDIFGEDVEFDTDIEEISALMEKQYGNIYSDTEALAKDVAWLDDRGFFSQGLSEGPIVVETIEPLDIAPHRYSDRAPFLRLLTIVRFVLHSPLQRQEGKSVQETLLTRLKETEQLYESRDNFRKDIELALKPYGLLPERVYRQGYFLGTAILTSRELNRIYRLARSQAAHLDDIVALETCELFRERLERSRLLTPETEYPLRVSGTRSIANIDCLPDDSLPKQIDRLEEAIETGELLELSRHPQSARFPGDTENLFLVYPLQLVFHRIAWYLGFEYDFPHPGLLRFERLDRLFFCRSLKRKRGMKVQLATVKRLQSLYQCSAGIFLGNSVEDQKCYLSSESDGVEVTVELWCNDYSFGFISEGTQRFPLEQMQMSLPPKGRDRWLPDRLFTAQLTGDKEFPHRFIVKLPRWSLQDVDLMRWILGFQENVKVVSPIELQEKIGAIGRAMQNLYC